MQGIWLISYVVLWLIVLVLAWLLITMLRLMGQLHERLGPAGAAVTSNGPDIGERLPDLMEAHKIVDQALLGFPKPRDSLLVFVAPSCPSCEELIKSLIPFSRREKELEVIMVSSATRPEENNHFASLVARSGVALMASEALTKAAKVNGTPFALWLDRDGTVHAKGIVNHSEHLESLKHAREIGFASLEAAHEEVNRA